MPPASSEPGPDAAWLGRHVARLRASYRQFTGRDLIAANIVSDAAPAALDAADFAVVSHGTETDPVFNYANHRALALFALDWDRFTRMPSRRSAQPVEQDKRAALLAQVARHGFVDGYSGIRIAADGRRFVIEDTTIWNVVDEQGNPAGQAARIGRWRDL